MLKNLALFMAAGALLIPSASARSAGTETNPQAGMLHEIIRDNRGFKALETAQDQGADINGMHQGETPLGFAARRGLKGYVDRLISRGADVNARDENGRAPLLLAIGGRHRVIAEWLLQEGANPGYADRDGNFPLYTAAAAGWSGMVAMLVEYGADVNARHAVADFSPLQIAVLRGRGQVEKILLQAGAKFLYPPSTAAASPPPRATPGLHSHGPLTARATPRRPSPTTGSVQ